MVAVRRLCTQVPDASVAVDAPGPRFIVSNMAVQKWIGNKGAAGGNDVASALPDRTSSSRTPTSGATRYFVRASIRSVMLFQISMLNPLN